MSCSRDILVAWLERDVRHALERHRGPVVGVAAAVRGVLSDEVRLVARRLVADEDAVLDERPPLRLHAVVVVAAGRHPVVLRLVARRCSRSWSRTRTCRACRWSGSWCPRSSPRSRARDRAPSDGRPTRGSSARGSSGAGSAPSVRRTGLALCIATASSAATRASFSERIGSRLYS